MRELSVNEVGFVSGGNSPTPPPSNQSRGSQAGGWQTVYDYRQAACNSITNSNSGRLGCNLGLALAEEPEILRRVGTAIGTHVDSLSNVVCQTLLGIENAARRAAGAPQSNHVCGG
jgi:hypothetical protein